MKNKWVLKMVFFSLIIAIGWYSCTLIMVGLHESVHQEIFREYGIESRIEYRGFLGLEAVTISESSCKVEECKLAHNINEVVSYNIYPFMLAFWIGLLILIFYLEWEEDK